MFTTVLYVYSQGQLMTEELVWTTKNLTAGWNWTELDKNMCGSVHVVQHAQHQATRMHTAHDTAQQSVLFRYSH